MLLLHGHLNMVWLVVFWSILLVILIIDTTCNDEVMKNAHSEDISSKKKRNKGRYPHVTGGYTEPQTILEGTFRNGFLWKPQIAGLMSQFFILKYMDEIARTAHNMPLILLPYISSHFNDQPPGGFNLCRIFTLPEDIQCVESASPFSSLCISTFGVKSFRFPCFRGTPWINTPGGVPDDDRLSVMNVGPRLNFSEYFHRRFQKIAASPFAPSGQYVIVHWRRGDQLETRCANKWKGDHDVSINCGEVSQLVRDVRTILRANNILDELPIYVATNENNSTTMKSFAKYNVTTLRSVIRKSNGGNVMMSLYEFVMECMFMMEAPILLTFGVSSVSDLIEHERMQRGKSFCFTKGTPDVSRWCGLFTKLTDYSQVKPVKSKFTLEDVQL